MTLHFAKRFYWLAVLAGLLLSVASAAAQSSVPADSVVPRLVNYAGVAKDENGKAMSGVIGATFAVYAEPQGGSPLWMETQNIHANANGTFSVQLGATKPDGLPVDLFSAGQARWLGVSYNGGVEQPRVALLSVPYALKAGDAQTLGGLPASAFALAAPSSSLSAVPSESTRPTNVPASTPPPDGSVTGAGTANFIPLWTSASDIENSVLFQSGSGSTGKVGVNTSTPAATLDVKGTGVVRGTLSLPAQSVATASKGGNSQLISLQGSSFNSGTAKAVNQTFAWQTQAAGNDTTSPSGTLNLMFASGTTAPANTGLNIGSNGQITFVDGQTFPGAGTITGVTTATGSGLTGGGTSGSLTLSLTNSCTTSQTLQWNGSAWGCATSGLGTITGVTAGNGITGGGTSGNVTVNIDPTKVAQLNAANTFNANQIITANGGNTALNVTQTAASGVTYAIIGTSRVPTNGDAAILGQQLANAEVFGVQGYISNSTGTGAGVFGSNAGPGAIGSTYKGLASGVWGDAGTFGTIGVLATADKGNGLVAYNNSSTFSAIVGENQNTATGATSLAPGVFGLSFAPVGLGVVGSGPVHSSYFNNNVGFNPVGVVGDSSASAGIGVWGVTDSGTSIYGSTSFGTGVFGLSSTGDGVVGNSSTNAGVSGGSTSGTGVFGISSDGNGVYGEGDGLSGAGGAGVYAFGQNGATGVYATTNGLGSAVVGLNNTDYYLNGQPTALFLNSGPTNQALPIALEAGTGTQVCQLYYGNLACTGSKSAMVPLPDNRWVRLYAMESPQNWFEDFGTGTLSHGIASVQLEATFRDTVTSSEDYHVFLTPRGECEGLYVANMTAGGFEVRELHHGTANVAFDYRIVVLRKGYEKIRMEDVTEMRRKQAARAQEIMNRPRPQPAPGRPSIGPARAPVSLPSQQQAAVLESGSLRSGLVAAPATATTKR